jgi:hypothetical protein
MFPKVGDVCSLALCQYTERAAIKKIEQAGCGIAKVKDERRSMYVWESWCRPDTGGSTFMAPRHLQASATPLKPKRNCRPRGAGAAPLVCSLPFKNRNSSIASTSLNLSNCCTLADSDRARTYTLPESISHHRLNRKYRLLCLACKIHQIWLNIKISVCLYTALIHHTHVDKKVIFIYEVTLRKFF